MDEKLFRPRDAAFVNFTFRYRIGTNRAYAKCLLAGRSLNAVSKVTARLCANGLLTRFMLIPPECYFRLGAKAVNSLGLSPRNIEPLGPQSLPIEFATLVYATQSETAKRRLSHLDLTEYAPWMPEEFRTLPYCVAADGRLELIRVDLGGSPQHVARKTSIAVHEHLKLPELADLAATKRFQVVLLTTSSQKAAFIAKALDSSDIAGAIPIHIAVVSQLSLLLLRSK